MSFVGELWLPILLSAVFVFLASAIIWTVMPHHKNEWRGFSDEGALRDALRRSSPTAGLYMFPFAEDPKVRQSVEFTKSLAEGPSGYVTLLPKGPVRMGPMMVKSFVFNLVVAFFTAYLAAHTMAAGASYMSVFRVVGTIGFMTYALGTVPDHIWFGRPWKSFYLQAGDSLVYGLLMAGTFAAFWPEA